MQVLWFVFWNLVSLYDFTSPSNLKGDMELIPNAGGSQKFISFIEKEVQPFITKKYKVNEVATQIGYTNPSHFIAAFRKKFGVTPKKYLMQLEK